MQVLIAEDDLATRKMLRFVMELQSGHNVVEAATGEDALRIIAEQSCDLLLTDLVMPDLDGFELVRRIRRDSSIPILIVSARAEVADRVRGLRSGADDYLPKPFDPAELVARTEALLRRVGRSLQVDREGRLVVGRLRLESASHTIELPELGRIRLTPTEFRLLLHLARAPGQVRTRQELEQAIWEQDLGGAPGALNTYISNLRHKLEADPEQPRLIETVRGKGYRLLPW